MTQPALCNNRLEDKVTIITGGASGIGEAAARLFAENGARVIIIDIQDELGHQVSASIGIDRATYIHCDVTNEEQVKATVDWALNTYGRLDVMFSNAGIGGARHQPSILDMDMASLNRLLGINVCGMAAAIKHAAHAMIETGVRGSIICTASVTATIGGVALHDYTVSKHAILGLVQSAASELGKHGIRVNCISPFAVATPLLCRAFEELGESSDCVEQISSSVSNIKGIILKVRHIADAALFLASDAAGFVSGHNLVVDGGFTVVNHSFKVYN